MLRKINLFSLIAILLLVGNLGLATTTLPLNTGYNHAVFAPYPSITGTPDNYWINIASFPTTTPAVGPSFVLNILGTPWAPPFPTTNWIGPRATVLSGTGTNQSNPAYTIFRKCFCLLPGFKEPKLTINRLRADDTVQVWLNTQLNQVIAPAWGNWQGQPLSGGTTKGFRVGKNCLYVLVEDFGGHMGFDLLGDITAFGLLPTAAAGTAQSFKPCVCEQGPAGLMDNIGGQVRRDAEARVQLNEDDADVIQSIVKLAEARRAAKQRMRYEGTPPSSVVAPSRVDPTKRPNN